MRRQESLHDQLKHYLEGWLEGSSGGEYPHPVGNLPEYLLGYSDGANAYLGARERTMKRLGILPDQDESSKDRSGA